MSWQQHINQLLTRDDQFRLAGTSHKGQTTTAVFQQQSGDTDTTITAGYLDDGRLIFLHITNPKTPGHNADQVDYFYENDFDESKRFGFTKTGLLFNEVNRTAIDNILKRGFQGTETKYYLDGKLQYAVVKSPFGEDDKWYSTTHHFAAKGFWGKLLKKLTRPNLPYETEEVELGKIFSGVKQHA